MTKHRFVVATDFAVSPGPRFSRQGPDSGEALRNKLVRVLKQNPQGLVVVLDGTSGFGSSFLDEAFGGLVRAEGYTPSQLKGLLEFVSDLDPTYVTEIWESVGMARPASLVGA
jgi:hypothetical protein